LRRGGRTEAGTAGTDERGFVSIDVCC
jgi:hypothetical protein